MTRIVVTVLVLGLGTTARAQEGELFAEPEFEDPSSPQHFTWEFRVGMYQPELDIFDGGSTDAFHEVFGDDRGPLIATEVGYFPLDIPYVGQLGGALSFGWVRYEASALTESNDASGEKTQLRLFPLSAMGAFRLDVLARELGIPFVLVGKIGVDIIPWTSDTGGVREGSGISIGLRWGAELQLELDFIEPRGMRRMDDEYGINHVFVFTEIYGSDAGANSINLGTKWTWAAGMGFAF